MRKKGRRNKKVPKVKTDAPEFEEPTALKNAPHTFVIHRGERCSSVVALSRDFRRMMEPFTASALRERRVNKVKDFVHLSGFFHVSHMCLFSLSPQTLSLKIIRMPKGPTLTFRVTQYTLAKDVISMTKKQFVDEESFHTPPLVILNSFSGEGRHLKLMASTFQNMFPPINLSTVKLSSLKRCVLLSYNPVSKLIDLRHYSVTVVPVNLNKGVKKVVTRNIPNMSKFEDIADFVEKGHLLSDSEFDDEETHVVLPQNLRRGNLADNKSSLRLHEIGPRITMRLMKIEEDLLTGEVLYHDYIQKNAIEVEELRKKRAAKKRLKEQRKEKQEENKKKKEQQKADHKAKTSGGTLTDRDKQLLKDAEEAIGEQSDEDDTRYYEDAIGEAPEKELFEGQSGTRKRPFIPKGSNYSLKPKKPKLDKKKEYDEDDRDDRRGRAGPRQKGKGGFKGKGAPGKKGGKFSGKKVGGDYKGKSKYAGKKGEGKSPKGQGKPKFKGGKKK
ncbi:protein Peter pan [Aedes albopictus]|uniref:Brix domain-containing protein n=1 Tax=Aedes albopictus TaxID=7160 RepID=A0ABM1YUJ6_AEDAL|nr:protein Peter pan-like [Aedes albopictus]XP_019544818.1 protein Peter pan-like [Aedes albopictus]